MNNMEPGVEMFSPETVRKSETDTNAAGTTGNASSNMVLSAKEDELISMETLRESPVQWPERFPGMDDFLTMSQTPIHTPNAECTQNFNSADMARMNQLASLTPEQLIDKIKSMHDEIYQLGLRESKEMTRGKLLGIFDRMAKGKK
ncbi:protein lin-52 homolog [Drosophila virilis]|uniref:Protein lin-52 homolog n=1 Tax=Drosophila virilis TaxID=7244 RepID=B4LBE8_DROVI|nr:protein lin-52 homolog [Drosophila virilis]EDW69736.1 uncharacterized protein Dvir_GJ13411 [Drosophila virilis]